LVEKRIIECPFCGKLSVDCIYFPPVLQTTVTRVSAKTSTQFYKTKEKYEVQSSCPNCGKSVKEIQKALDEGKRDPEKDKKILKRLKEQGLDFTTIKTKF